MELSPQPVIQKTLKGSFADTYLKRRISLAKWFPAWFPPGIFEPPPEWLFSGKAQGWAMDTSGKRQGSLALNCDLQSCK